MDKTSYKKYTIKAQIRKDRKLPKNVPNSILIVLVLLHCKRIGELDYIKAIAQVHSVSLAAERLGISQPALSAHLRKKEKELGVKLFDRRKQPLELTEAGKAYLEYAEKAASLEDEMHQRLSDIESLQTGHLTIGGASFFNNAYLPQAIVAFQKKYPGIELEIIDGKVPEIV
ncbi:MAG: LysR family transcriptional regulator, partial [Firmicutes bacterium]|nr:LysR family transcriptional regulator [Bacillota bacterium]